MQRLTLKLHLALCKHCERYLRQLSYMRELAVHLKANPAELS
jgi:hypothetical protein